MYMMNVTINRIVNMYLEKRFLIYSAKKETLQCMFFSVTRYPNLEMIVGHVKDYKYLSCVPGVDGKIHPEGVVQHRR